MAAFSRIFVACTLALILLPEAQAQTRKSIGAWTIVCSGGATGYCSASNRIKSADASPYRFQLNVSRGEPGAQFEIALLTGREHPADGTVIAVQVDGGKALNLAPGEGYRRAGRSHTYVVAAGQTAGLLKQLSNGKRVRFRFEDAKGGAVDAAFPLGALGNAIALMDKMQPAPRPRAPTAAVAPAAKPPGRDEPRPAPPVQQAEPSPLPTPAPSTPPVTASLPEPPAKEVASAPAIAPAPPAKEVAPAVTTRPTPPAKEVTPAPPIAPAPPAKEVPPAPVIAAAPPAKEVAPAPVTAPASPAPAPTGAPAPRVREAQAEPAPTTGIRPKPAPMQSAAPAPVPAEQAPAGAKRKPAQAQTSVAAAAPSASRKRGAKSVRQFSCRGNEPFWTLVIDSEKARYSSLTDSGESDSIELTGKLNVTGDGPTPIVDWRGKSDWGGSFRAVVTEQRCRDSMSDSEGQVELEYRAQVSLPGGKTIRGCCNAGLPPVEAPAATDTTQYPIAQIRTRPETDWSRYLLELLPAIQACIDKTPEPAPYATKAWPMNRGMVGVRTRNSRGGWFECVAEASGKSVDRFVPLPSAAPPAPNEARVLFSPPDRPPPAGGCYRHERVMDGMGDFMGWLSTNSCS